MSLFPSTTFMTAINLFQAREHDERLPSGLVEREGVTQCSNSALTQHCQQPPRSEKSRSPAIVRDRTFTRSSLYAALDKSLVVQTDLAEHRIRAVSSPAIISFADPFMKPRTRSQSHQPWHPQPQTSTPSNPGCIFPDSMRTKQPFDIGSIRGHAPSGAPAWWCRQDKMVIFDGVRVHTETGVEYFLCRTSKGLESSRIRCPKESISVELDCAHCRDMLGKKTKWVYEARVMELSVCRRCQERCAMEEHRKKRKMDTAQAERAGEDNRRDSFLAEGSPTVEFQLVSEQKDLRKIQSDRFLRRPTAWSINALLPAGSRRNSTHEQAPHRRNQSENHLPATPRTNLSSELTTQ